MRRPIPSLAVLLALPLAPSGIPFGMPMALAQGRVGPGPAPLPGYACSLLRGTPEQIRSGAAVPVYDKSDPQARRPLRTAAGVPMTAPFLVFTRHPRVVENGLVAMKTYDNRDGWVPLVALGAPLALPDSPDMEVRRANPHSIAASCQPLVYPDGRLGAG